MWLLLASGIDKDAFFNGRVLWQYGKSIELFLVNGSADSLIIAELSNWNGKAIKIPRIEVASCNRDDITQAGVYFLFCKEEDTFTTILLLHTAVKC